MDVQATLFRDSPVVSELRNTPLMAHLRIRHAMMGRILRDWFSCVPAKSQLVNRPERSGDWMTVHCPLSGSFSAIMNCGHLPIVVPLDVVLCWLLGMPVFQRSAAIRRGCGSMRGQAAERRREVLAR